jgi:hypothetical protein
VENLGNDNGKFMAKTGTKKSHDHISGLSPDHSERLGQVPGPCELSRGVNAAESGTRACEPQKHFGPA